MKKTIQIIGGIFGVIALMLIGYTIIVWGSVFYELKFNQKSKLFIIPENYSGYFRVIYGQECGEELSIKEGREIIKIPSNGILITSSDYQGGVINNEYYLSNDRNELILIDKDKPLSISSKKTAPYNVEVGATSTYNGITHIEYFFTNKTQLDSPLNSNDFDQLMNQALDDCNNN
jgi:hypothetical protein